MSSVAEQTQEFIRSIVGEYEIQTVELIQVTTDSAITMEVVPDGMASLDYMWFLGVLIALVPIKVTYDFMKWCISHITRRF